MKSLGQIIRGARRVAFRKIKDVLLKSEDTSIAEIQPRSFLPRQEYRKTSKFRKANHLPLERAPLIIANPDPRSPTASLRSQSPDTSADYTLQQGDRTKILVEESVSSKQCFEQRDPSPIFSNGLEPSAATTAANQPSNQSSSLKMNRDSPTASILMYAETCRRSMLSESCGSASSCQIQGTGHRDISSPEISSQKSFEDKVTDRPNSDTAKLPIPRLPTSFLSVPKQQAPRGAAKVAKHRAIIKSFVARFKSRKIPSSATTFQLNRANRLSKRQTHLLDGTNRYQSSSTRSSDLLPSIVHHAFSSNAVDSNISISPVHTSTSATILTTSHFPHTHSESYFSRLHHRRQHFLHYDWEAWVVKRSQVQELRRQLARAEEQLGILEKEAFGR